MAKKRQKPKLGSHQIGFVADSDIDSDVRASQAWMSRALHDQWEAIELLIVELIDE
jgi:hypothetical protein